MESLTKVQKTIVQEFAAKHQVSTEVALRFLLGRKWDRDRADTLLSNYAKLKTDNGFENVTINDVMEEFKTGKLSLLGSKAKDGSTLLFMNGLKHTPGQFTEDSTLKLSFFMAETVTSTVDAQRDGITVICYLEDLNWEQSDYAFYKKVVQLFQDNFPCRVKNIFVFSPPWWISMLIAFVKPVMKPKMRDRIHIVTDREALQEWIEKEALPVELDGECKYDQESFIRRQMAKTSTAKITGLLQMESVELREDDSTEELDVTDDLAEELVEERERAVEELEAAIQKRRSSLTSQQAPIDFTKLARSKAARLTVSLADSMPVVTPVAPIEDYNHSESESEIVDVETITPVEQAAETLPADKEHPTLETIPEEKSPSPVRGFMDFSEEDEGAGDREEDGNVDVEKLDEEDDKPEPTAKPKARRRTSKKPRPTAIQM